MAYFHFFPLTLPPSDLPVTCAWELNHVISWYLPLNIICCFYTSSVAFTLHGFAGFLIPMCSSWLIQYDFSEGRKRHIGTQGEDSHVRTETETGVMHLQGWLATPEAGEGRK